MNNYKKQPFIPAIQKTTTLVALSFLALACFIIAMNFKTIDVSPSYKHKIKAANLMQEAMRTLKNHRMEESIFIDIENDPNVNFFVPPLQPPPTKELFEWISLYYKADFNNDGLTDVIYVGTSNN